MNADIVYQVSRDLEGYYDIVFDIIIPTLGRDNSLQQAVQSAILQLGDAGQIIVVNDGDIDVERIIKDQFSDYIHKSRLVITENSGPHGAARARNLGASISTATVLFFLDDDDVLLPGSVTRAMDAAEIGYEYGYSVKPVRRLAGLPGLDVQKLPVKQRFAATSAAFWIRRDLFNTIGQFCPNMTVGEDFDLCARLLCRRSRGWGSFEAGVARGRISEGKETQSLVKRTATVETVRCRHALMTRNIDNFSYWRSEKYYLVEQFVRRAVRSGMSKDCLSKIIQQMPSFIGVFGLFIWLSNFFAAPRDSRS